MQNNMQWNPELYNHKHAFVANSGKNLIDLIDLSGHERVLDLGCGTGYLTYQLSEKAREVVGMDKSENMIIHAKADYPEIKFVVGDASNFNFSKPFDAVFSNAALHWVKDYKGAIQSVYNNLNKNGKLVLEMGGKGNVHSIVTALQNKLGERGLEENSKNNPWFFPSISEYTNALEHAGFTVNYAHLFDRPTPLAQRDSGIKDWLIMFGGAFFEGLAPEMIAEIVEQVQSELEPVLLKDGQWLADYKRLRIVAHKN